MTNFDLFVPRGLKGGGKEGTDDCELPDRDRRVALQQNARSSSRRYSPWSSPSLTHSWATWAALARFVMIPGSIVLQCTHVLFTAGSGQPALQLCIRQSCRRAAQREAQLAPR